MTGQDPAGCGAASGTAGLFGCLLTGFAGKILEMAVQIGAIDVPDGRCSAMFADGDRSVIFRMIDRDRDALIEHITESVPQSSFHRLILAVGDDPSVQLRYIIETLAQHECSQFLAADTAGAVGEDRPVLLVAEILADPLREIAEGPDGRADRIPEMSEIVFIIGPSVQDHHVILLHGLVPFLRGQIAAGLFQRTAVLSGAERNEFIFHTDEQFVEHMTVGLVRLKDDIGEPGIHRERIDITLGLIGGAGYRSVDPFGRDEDTSAQSQLPAEVKMMLRKEGIPVDRDELIIEQYAVCMCSVHEVRYGKIREFLKENSEGALFHMLYDDHGVADGISGRRGKIRIEPSCEAVRCGADLDRKSDIVLRPVKVLKKIR